MACCPLVGLQQFPPGWGGPFQPQDFTNNPHGTLTLPKMVVSLPMLSWPLRLFQLSCCDPGNPLCSVACSPLQASHPADAPLPSCHPALTQGCPPASQLARPAFQLPPSHLIGILLTEKTSLNSACIRPTLTQKRKAKTYYQQDEAPTLQLGIYSSSQAGANCLLSLRPQPPQTTPAP